MRIFNITFQGKPNNYAVIDKFLSRSAQPAKEDFKWLKEQGVTDIINFRTMHAPGINFDEKAVVEKNGMHYHNIPTVSKNPKESLVKDFLGLVKDIISRGGKAHIHCKAGADRTGMYSFIYKELRGIGSTAENEKEWIQRGHDTSRYPDMINWTKNLLKKLHKKS